MDLLTVAVNVTIAAWLGLAILLVVPTAVLIRRIGIEEAVMTEVLGRAYTDYAASTKRLVPGLW